MITDVKLLILDVDGTLTDGKIYISANGEIMKAFNCKDGYGIAHLSEYGVTPVIITGRQSEIVSQRAKELNITEVYQGVHDKTVILRDLCFRLGITTSQCAYIGDDLNDFPCMQLCGITAAPADATAPILASVDYVCKANGGSGAVREFIDFLIGRKSE